MELIPDLTVCVHCDEEGNSVLDFLASLQETAGPVAVETIVIGLARSRKAATEIAAHFPNVMHYESQPGEPATRLINHALRLARGRYVSLWDEESLIRPDCLKTLIDFLDDNPITGLAGPTVVDRQGARINSRGKFPGLLDFAGLIEADTLTRSNNIDMPFEVDWLGLPGLIIRQETLEDVGLLDEGFSSNLVCADLCRRARRAGWHVHVLPAAIVATLQSDQSHKERSSWTRPGPADRVRFLWRKLLGSSGPHN